MRFQYVEDKDMKSRIQKQIFISAVDRWLVSDGRLRYHRPVKNRVLSATVRFCISVGRGRYYPC